MRNKLTDELAVCGLHAVLALARVHPEQVNRLFLREDRMPLFSGLCKNLAERKRPYKICGDEELEKICKSARHQGAAAMILEPSPAALEESDLEAWAAEGKTGIILHSVGNDHNLGAIVRSAAFFGTPYVIISDTDEAAQLTTSAYRVAEGGMEYVNIRVVHNTAAFVKSASRLIVTIGTDVRARQRIRDLPLILRKNPLQGTGRPGAALVMGNEETGLPQGIKDSCAALVRIPGTGNIESLNVAQAAALFLHELYEL